MSVVKCRLTTDWVWKCNKFFLNINTRKFSKNVKSDEKIKIPPPEDGKIQAAVLEKFSEPLVIENLDAPANLNTNEVLIDVQYCTLNGPDILKMKNLHKSPPKLPAVLGYELAGKLLEVGDQAKKQGFKVGDKVVALNKTRYGGLAERCIAEMTDVWKIPSSVKTLETVCLMDNYLTALIGLEKKADLQEDEMVLINVGLGGIGLAAVDIAANVFRAQVIGVSKSEDRTTLVRDKGAFASLKYSDKKLMKKIVEFAAERDIKDVFDGAEGEKFKLMLECFTNVYKEENQNNLLRDDNFSVLIEHLSREGRIIIAGFAVTKDDYDEDSSKKCPFSITGIDLVEFKKKHLESYREAGNDILQYHEEGLIKPSYSFIVGLHKINEAVKFISDFKCSDKIVVDLKNREAEIKLKDK
ncbi:quinone oxidoreductase-like protein 2 homolog [Microplitis mediator]|uniref:quinone oxidoreductase-like protein 2 homolog n=1 Tax=Microplitis mediator TaxID=375433 RepID=UPI0025526226|nr:quinone oxidoreductase-like protein 2 homolog [Microplitis mediator]